MKIFLKMKAWQLFLIFTIPLVLPAFYFPDLTSWIFSIIQFFWGLALFGWMFAVGSASNAKLSGELTKKSTFFRGAILYVLVYFILAQLFVFGPALNGNLVEFPGWIVPAHLFGMFCAFYVLWFTAKQFTRLVRNADVAFMDYSGPFFPFWFSPIGVWFLQPKINEVLGVDS